MSSIGLMETMLPPGFRFHPKDEELVMDYLAKKVIGRSGLDSFLLPSLVEVDLNKIEPWDLPACVDGKEWYFFSLRDRKYATGLRTNRATLTGYWKATGKDRRVMDIKKKSLVGMRKTLVFYQGRAPKGKKTEWVMHEFRLEGIHHLSQISSKDDWVLCRVFYKDRGISTLLSQDHSFDDIGSSVPPLMDSLPSVIDQTPLTLDEFQQVPCFSNIYSQNHTISQTKNLTTPSLSFDQSEIDLAINNGCMAQLSCGAPPDFPSFLDPLSYEKEVIEEVLDHFNKMEGNTRMLEEVSSSCLAEESSDSFLSELGTSSIWDACLF